jgi:hypothetical protein
MKFEYKPGVRYEVFVGVELTLTTKDAGKSYITDAVKKGAVQLLSGKADEVRIVGDDGSLWRMTA